MTDPDLFISSRRRHFLRRWLAAGAAALVLAGAGIGAYLVLKRPGDVSNPDVQFAPTQPKVKKRAERRLSWPLYGYDPQRTRYLPARAVSPPFRRVWSFTGSVLLEYSPILVGGTLYLVKNSGGVFAIRASDGKLRWKRSAGYKSASSAAYGDGRIYVTTLHPRQITAMRARSGKVVWRKTLPGRSESSPVYDRGRVYFGCECGVLYAFDADTGRTVWSRALGGAVKAAPALSHRKLFVGTYGGRMWAIRAGDGSVVWSAGAQGSGLGRGAGNFYATPAVAFGRVYAGATDGRIYSYSTADGSLAWSHSTGAYVYAAAAVADTPETPPTVYVGSYDGNFYALDAKTGARRWSYVAGGRISGAASVIGKTVYFSNLGAHSTTGLDVVSGKPVFHIGRGAFNPAISDGKWLYLTGYSSLYAFAPKAARTSKKAKRGDRDRRKKRSGSRNAG
jgi:outer membrane protein assembly factor BamB